MPKKFLASCVRIVLMTIILFCTGYGLAENEDGLHLYQEIPFQGTSPEAVLQILMEKTGLPLEAFHEVFGGKSEAIMDFGYEWNLQVDFEENGTDVNRILLSRAQIARVESEEFQARLHSDLLEFIDLEKQLTALYGEPDFRFFYTETRKDIYMFPNRTWKIEQMMGVFEENRVFRSFSNWGNVMLQTWIDALDVRYADKPLSRVMLSFYPESIPPPPTIPPFLPHGGE